jgi:hypothetical protein
VQIRDAFPRRILDAATRVLDFPDEMKKVADLMHGHVSFCIQAEGGSFEHLLDIRQ